MITLLLDVDKMLKQCKNTGTGWQQDWVQAGLHRINEIAIEKDVEVVMDYVASWTEGKGNTTMLMVTRLIFEHGISQIQSRNEKFLTMMFSPFWKFSHIHVLYVCACIQHINGSAECGTSVLMQCRWCLTWKKQIQCHQKCQVILFGIQCMSLYKAVLLVLKSLKELK